MSSRRAILIAFANIKYDVYFLCNAVPSWREIEELKALAELNIEA